MQSQALKFEHGFRLALGNARSQAAEMVLRAGETEGGPQNRHRGSDQWLFVVEGAGVAIVNGHSYPLKAGVLLLIEAGDTHEIRASESAALQTLNIYIPPAYLDNDTPLPNGQP